MSRNRSQQVPGLPPRGPGRPSSAELALRAEALARVAQEPGAAPEPRAPQGPVVSAAAPGAIEGPRVAGLAYTAAEAEALSACDRDDPRKLGGEALRRFAHGRGIPRSEMAGWDDDKVRFQAKLLVNRQYDNEGI